MTRNMKETLQHAARQELRAADAHRNTLAALVRHGLLERSERVTRHQERLTVWTITDAGRATLRPRERVPVERPTFMAHGAIRYRLLPNNRWAVVQEDEDGSYVDGDYTQDPRRRFDSLEVVGEASVVWRRRAEVARLGVQDRRVAAGRAVRVVRAA